MGLFINVDPDKGGLAAEQLHHLGQMLERGHHVHVGQSSQGPAECWGGDPDCVLWKRQQADWSRRTT